MSDEGKGLPEFVANITDNIIIEVAKSGDVLFFNDKAACIFIGISKYSNLLKIIRNEDALVLKRNFDTAFYHQYPHYFYHKIKGRFYLIYMYPKDASLWISMSDITEKRQQAHLLHVNAQRIEFSESNLKFGYWELDAELKRFYWSKGMYDIFGLTNYNQTYKKNLIREFVHPEDIEIYKLKLKELIEEGHNVEGNIRIITPIGNLKYCHFIAGVLYENGDTKIVGVFNDITSLIENEQKLLKERDKIKEENIKKTQILAEVSHDIKQYFHIINVLSSSFDKTLPKECLDAMKNIYQITDNSLELLDNIMDVSKIDLGGLVFDPKFCDLGEIVKKLADNYKIIAEGLKIDLRCKNEHINLYQDVVLITRILSNLISNAIKYAKSKIVIGNSSKSFWVIDDGCGIDKNNLKYIFNEFYQGEETSHQTSKGAGLGLYIVKKIVDVIGGKIKVRSIKGKYTVFVVYL